MGGGSKFEGGGGTFPPRERYRAQSYEVDPQDEIMMNFHARIINDLLQGKLDEDMLRRINAAPDMTPKNEMVPWWYKPIS